MAEVEFDAAGLVGLWRDADVELRARRRRNVAWLGIALHRPLDDPLETARAHHQRLERLPNGTCWPHASRGLNLAREAVRARVASEGDLLCCLPSSLGQLCVQELGDEHMT